MEMNEIIEYHSFKKEKSLQAVDISLRNTKYTLFYSIR